MAQNIEEKIITGPLEKTFCTDKVIKFMVSGNYFVGFDKNYITLLKDYLTQEREGIEVRVVVPQPEKKSRDKILKVDQIILTNHTKIFLEDQLIFFPAEQQEDVDLINDAIDTYVEEEQKQKDLIEQKRELGKPALPKQINRAYDLINKDVVKEGGFYKVGDKKIPDAYKIQGELNNLIEKSGRSFNLLIIECDKNDDKAWAKVRVEDNDTHQSIEDEVVHHYNTLRDAFLLDLLNSYEKALRQGKQAVNPIEGFDEFNKPILTKEAQKSIVIRTLKFKQFAERDAITKAASRAYLKILNREWRSKEELASEQLEVELVNSQN